MGTLDDDALADLRARYRGTASLDDMLRWRADPQALGSEGNRSPVALAADLKPLIYRRADSPDAERERDAAAAQAELLLAQWAADSSALDVALRERPHSEASERRPRRQPVPRGRIALLAGAGLLALVVVVALATIIRPAAPAAERADLPTSTPAPLVTTTPTPTPAFTPPPAPPFTATPIPEDTDLRPDYFDNNIMSVQQVPIDGAPIDNANGVASIDDYGVPLSYVVANGDVFELIAKRFDLGTSYLASINAVRRANPTELFVGDTLNLSANTILRIGDQNGTVYNFTDRLPEPHLDQY